MNNINSFFLQPQFQIIFLLWIIFWKGAALWKAARSKHLVWFILLLILNTAGILDILYIFFLNRWDIDNGQLLKLLEKKFKKNKK
jgi:hypothetical protein